jgi:two-component system nitrate/nitrite sensor histidine kinase NarX
MQRGAHVQSCNLEKTLTRALTLAMQKLGTKLALIVTGYLLVALIAIGLTLLASWDLEGGAAAVNQAGSQRMRIYHIAMLISQAHLPDVAHERIYADVNREVAAFDASMAALKAGDPARPMFLPRDAAIQRQFADLQKRWSQDMKPALAALIASPDANARDAGVVAYREASEKFVTSVDRMVYAIEQEISSKTALLRFLQLGLMALSLAGTVSLIYLMFLLVVRPLNRLEEGMRNMQDGKFDTRLPIESRDEFGSLAAGFNGMAAHLQDLYHTLEDKVAQKTQSLEGQNRELSTLYEVAALLNHPGTLEDMCRDFLRKLMATLKADGGAVRLTEERTGKIHLYIHEKLAPAFVSQEMCLERDECLCGHAAQQRASVVRLFATGEVPQPDYNCRKAGYGSVSVFAIQFKNQVLGIFNLYFRQARGFSESERLMLESLGQHLGVAIENQRLVAREKEMAVSEERNLLAQELHDSIAQSLAFLNLQAQMLEDALAKNDLAEARGGVSQMREGIQESYDDVRELLVHFRTRFGESDLETAARALLGRFEADTGIATTYKQSGTGVPLSPEIQIQALHIIQECLSNARKHSSAGRVSVELECGPVYTFRVSDDGRGFDPGARADGHVGLAIMRERAHRIGGQIAVASRPGDGTCITLRLPILQEVAA